MMLTQWKCTYSTNGVLACINTELRTVEITLAGDQTPRDAAKKVLSLLEYLPRNFPVTFVINSETEPLLTEICRSGYLQTGGTNGLGPVRDSLARLIGWSAEFQKHCKEEERIEQSNAKLRAFEQAHGSAATSNKSVKSPPLK